LVICAEWLKFDRFDTLLCKKITINSRTWNFAVVILHFNFEGFWMVKSGLKQTPCLL